MVNMRHLDFFLISLCVLHLFTQCEGRPLRKRTVSEVQLMHNVGVHQRVKERQNWLLTRLQGVSSGSSVETTRTKRRLSPEELSDLSGMTPEEIQYALDLFDSLEAQQA
ncbi:Parathyroid hormone [Collichthys lucidus]|uniref:Parathyroid hormone n=1 Tax=Collichthys lucidus TaxID=240159 RepID=A0A4U5UEA0_COLLU|nr:Parathyroid hormone [Collichthys lucidus]